MENKEIKAMSLSMIMVTIAIDAFDQAKLNYISKEIVQLHRSKSINAMYGNLAKEFGENLKAGPAKFAKKVQDELHLISGGNISSFLELRNECPLIAYALVTNIKVIATFDFCQSINSRIYAAYVTAVQSLDGLI